MNYAPDRICAARAAWPRNLLASLQLLVALIGLCLPVADARGAAIGPVEVIPITQFKTPYFYYSEDGNGISCGAYLQGSFPVYKNYTNLSSYTLNITGLNGWSGIRGWDERNPGVGGKFVFTATFTGSSGPASANPDCGKYMNAWADLPPWTASVVRLPPRASFTMTPVPGSPGTFKFQSTSTHPAEDPLTEAWTFSDGSTGSGTVEIHQFTKPLSYNIRLVVTAPDGQNSTSDRSLIVRAPIPVSSISLQSKHKGNRIELEEEFGLRVAVEATEDGAGPLSALAFVTNAITLPDLFTVLQAPSSLEIGTLEPGQRREFNWRLRANKVGQFGITSSSVTGRDASNRQVSGAGAGLRGQVTALVVGVHQNPPKVAVGGDNNADGKTNDLDRLVEVIVAITNVSKQVVTEVQAVIPSDPIQLTSLAEDLNIWLTPIKVPPGIFGTIQPGAANAVRVTNVYEATDRTYAEASIILQGKVENTGVQAAGEGIVDIGGETLLEARFDIEDRPYRAGQVVRVFGSLKNVSRFKARDGSVLREGKTLGVVVFPTIEGNGALGYVFEKDSGGRTPDGPTTFLLEPDQTVEIEAIVPTAEVATNTTTRVNYSIAGYVHGEDPKPRRMRPSEIEVVEKPSEGWSANHEVELVGVPVVTDPWLVCPTELSFGGFVSCRFTEGLGNLGGSLADLTMLVGSGVREIGVGAYRLVGWKLWAVEEALKGLKDPAARARLAQEVAIDLMALKAIGVESLQAVEIGVESIGPAIEQAIINTGKTLETGDLKIIAGGVARITGENIDLPLEGLIAARSLRKAMLIREGAEDAAKKALRESLQRQTDELGGKVDEFAARSNIEDLPTSDVLPIGVNVINSPRIYRDAYGVLKEELDAFLKLAKEEGVIIAFRSRSPLAAQLIQAGTHLLKPHGVGIKTVSELDVKYLGYPSQFQAECVLVSPPIPWMHPGDLGYQDAINAFLDRFPDLKGGDDASRHLRAQVEERLKFQLAEWPKQIGNFKKYKNEGIDIDFRIDKQKLKLGLADVRNGQPKRAAQLEYHEFKDPYTGEKRRAYRLLMEDGPGSRKFKPITGDIDLIAILTPDGKLPSLLQRIRLYKKLRAMGAQHGESFSFFMKDLRAKFLRCCSPTSRGGDGERMLAVTPHDQVLTTQFVDNLSLIEGGANNALKVGDDEFAFFAGTLFERESAIRAASEELPGLIHNQLIPLVSASALARMVDELTATVDRRVGPPVRIGPDGNPEVYEENAASSGSPALAASGAWGSSRPGRVGLMAVDPIDQSLSGDLNALTAAGWSPEPIVRTPGAAGGQWRPATADEIKGGISGQGIRIAPFTYLASDTPAGATVLPALTRTEMDLPGGSQFFAAGDRVVIDPGGPREQFAILVTVQPFTLDRPLNASQEMGTTVLFLSGVADSQKNPGALPSPGNLVVWLRSDAGVEMTGTNVTAWHDQSPHRFVFRPPTEAQGPSWMANAANGQPALNFGTAAREQLQANLQRTLTNATIFSVCRFLATGSGRYVYTFGTRNFSGLMMTLARRSGDGAYHYDGAAERIADNAIGGTNWMVFTQVYGEQNPAHHRLARNSETLLNTFTSNQRPYSAVATNVILGNYLTGNSHLGGDILEWIVYDRCLSPEECLEVETYLAGRAGLGPLLTPGSLGLAKAQAMTIPVDVGPAPTWTLNLVDRSVTVTNRSDPGLLIVPETAGHAEVRARIRGNGTSGFIGFAAAYQGAGNFVLFDWNIAATNHPVYGLAPRGMRLRQFHLPPGVSPSGADLWSGTDPLRVTTYGTNAVPWVAGQTYDLVIRSLADRMEVEIRRGTNVVQAWSVPELANRVGSAGFYTLNTAGFVGSDITLPGSLPVITDITALPDGTTEVAWQHGSPPFALEVRDALESGSWIEASPATMNLKARVMLPPAPGFLRVRALTATPH